MSYGVDPYNRAPSPYHRPPSPYRAPSPYRKQSSNTLPQNSTPTNPGQVSPGQITYTTTIGPDGKTVYHSFKAVPASYQTPNGIVSGIQWVPAEATQILPFNAIPANSDFYDSWQRGGPEHDREREWQREDDKHRRHEEKEALRREKERRRRERIKKRELAQACERDRQAQFQTAPANHVPRSVSPYQTGGQPPGARPVSPHHPGGQLPGQRHVSTYQLTGTLPAPDQLPGQRPVFPYQGGGQLPGQRPVSPYHDGGALPNTKPIFPHHGGDNLPPAPASTYYFNPNYGSAYNEVEGGMGDLGIGGKANECHSRKKNTGYQPAPGGDYPLPNACYAATIVWFGCKYNGSAYQFFQEEATVALPESFNRIPSPAWAFTPFNEFKIQDLDRLEGNMPRMPKDIDVHDVLHVDWIRFMLDLTGAWIEQLPIPESAKQNGRPPERRDVVTGVVEDWNKKFFFRRGIEAIVYKGRERITDKYAGRVDTNLPDFNFTAGVTTDSGDDYASPSERRERWEPKKFRELGKLENKNKYTLYLWPPLYPSPYS